MTAEDVSAALRYIEEVKLPFTLDSLTELANTLRQFFDFTARLHDAPLDEQNKRASWLIQACRLFFAKVIKCYPRLFVSDAGDEVENEAEFGSSTHVAQDVREEAINRCYGMLSTIVSMTDRYESVQKACCSDGLVQFIVTDILPQCLNVKWEELPFNGDLVVQSLGVVYNCCKVPANNIYYEEVKAVDMLLKIRKKTKERDFVADTLILLTLGYLLDESNNKEIISGQDTIKQILEYVVQSSNDGEHHWSGFHLEEFLTGLSHLAVNDENKDLICDEGGIPVLQKVLESSSSDNDIIACCNALWLLCFCKKGASLIDENKELKTLLSSLKASENVEVQRYASGVLWQLKNTEKKIQDSKGVNGSIEPDVTADKARSSLHDADEKHVMISYQWDNQPLVKKIADYLKERGFKVWFDLYDMKGYIMDDMATAVENASYLIVCLSRRYKNSPNTRRECDYAFQLGKDFIPLMMEENYKPDGWLGILLGTKLWTDFTDNNLFEHKMKDLCSRLGNVCKTVELAVSPIRESVLTAGNAGTDDPFYGQHHPLQHFDEVDSGKSEQPHHTKSDFAEMETTVFQWTNSETVAWAKRQGIAGFMKNGALEKIDGLHLVMLYRLKQTHPSVYYKTIMPQLGGGDVLDALSFSYHLEALFETTLPK